MEAMVPAATAANRGAAPLRMAFIYSPNGKNMERWHPAGLGGNYKLSPTLQPLASLKSEFQVLSGLDHKNATAGGD